MKSFRITVRTRISSESECEVCLQMLQKTNLSREIWSGVRWLGKMPLPFQTSRSLLALMFPMEALPGLSSDSGAD